MALDAPPAAVAPNATAEHEAAGGDFDAALAAAMADDAGEADADETVAASGEGETPADGGEPALEGETPAEPREAKAPKDKDAEPTEPAKLRVAIEAEVRTKLRGEFSALARDRSKLRERESAAAATEQRAQAHVQKAQAFDQVVTRLLGGDVSVIRELAPDRADDVINKLLDGIVASEKSPAEREVERMRRELKARDEATQIAQQKATVDAWQAGVRREVETAGERFDLVNSLGQHDAVIATIEAYYTKYPGNVLPVEDAAQAVEDTLAKGLAKSKKFGARAPVNNAKPSTGNPAPSVRKGGSTTLSSVPSGELPSSDDSLPLDDPKARFDAVMASLT